MLLQDQIAAVIDAQNEVFLNRDAGLPRTLLHSIKLQENFALIITGIRRCGKSTLLLQLKKSAHKTALFLNFEDTRLAGFDTDDFIRLNNEIISRKTKVLFFDEIQILHGWELFIRQKLDEGYKIIVTGSNATLLSRELGTKLTGRHISIELFPFSYTEFLQFKNLENDVAAFEGYLHKGGFPEYLKTDNPVILNQLLDDILHRDIAVRYGVKDISSLKQLAVYLISNIGKPVSATGLKDLFGIKSVSTILDYFSYLENTYVLQFVPMFSYSLKKQIRNLKKVYTIDLGLFSANSIVFSDEKGRRLENMVYLYLRKKYKEIYYYQQNKECDFVVIEKGEPKEIIQVCYELTQENLEREIQGLADALDFFKVKEGKLLTFNQSDIFTTNGKKIVAMPARDFFVE